MPIMNWDDLRYVLAVADMGTLLGASQRLGVDHTTVGRRIRGAEQALNLRLFTRSRVGYRLTAEGRGLLERLRQVEAAVSQVELAASARHEALSGTVRLTSPETFGTHYLASRLGAFQRAHPGVVVELVPAGDVLDLARGEAQIAIRGFRTDRDGLVLRRVATVHYGFYGERDYLDATRGRRLADHPILSIPPESDEVEQRWLAAVVPSVRPTFVSPVSSALQQAARAGAGLAVLPCYLGDPDPALSRFPVPNAPSEDLWMTVHRDLRRTPRVRALMDFLADTMRSDEPLFRGVSD